MEDPKERQIRELSQGLTGEELRRFCEEFPEFSRLSDSPALRHLVSHALLFSSGAFENDVYLLSRIDAFRGLCLELLQNDTADSTLFSWIANVGKGKKGAGNLEKFLINFQNFLAPKIGNIAQQPKAPLPAGADPLAALEDVSDFKDKFPLFALLDETDPLLNHLVLLVKTAELDGRMGYQKEKKYGFFYYAIRIGALINEIVEKRDFSPIKKDELMTADLTTLKDMVSPTTRLLPGLEQCALFKVMRNIVADHFHYMDEKACEIFFKEFCKLLRGESCAVYAAPTKSKFKGTEKGIYKNLKRKDRELAVNVLAQMKYFLEKAQFFIKFNDFQSACMALVAAGNCAKDFNLSTFNERKMEVTGLIRILRDNNFAHIYEFWIIRENLAQQLQVFPQYPRRIIEEAQAGHNLKVEDAASSLGVDSPRTYRK